MKNWNISENYQKYYYYLTWQNEFIPLNTSHMSETANLISTLYTRMHNHSQCEVI